MALFKRSLLALVLSGRKTQTRRIHKNEWIVGKTYKVRDCYTTKGKDSILITRKYKQRLGDISETEAYKEGFNDIEEFKQTWVKINGSWSPDLIVSVYEFCIAKNP